MEKGGGLDGFAVEGKERKLHCHADMLIDGAPAFREPRSKDKDKVFGRETRARDGTPGSLTLSINDKRPVGRSRSLMIIALLRSLCSLTELLHRSSC